MSNNVGLLLSGLGLLLAFQIDQAICISTIEIKSYRHEINGDYFRDVSLKLLDYGNHKAINGSVFLIKDLDAIDMTYMASVPRAKAKPWTLLNVTTDGCQLLDGGPMKSLNIPYIILNELRSSGVNFPEKCPIKKGKETVISDFYLKAEQFPQYFPDVTVDGYIGVKSRNVDIFKAFGTVAIKSRNVRTQRG